MVYEPLFNREAIRKSKPQRNIEGRRSPSCVVCYALNLWVRSFCPFHDVVPCYYEEIQLKRKSWMHQWDQAFSFAPNTFYVIHSKYFSWYPGHWIKASSLFFQQHITIWTQFQIPVVKLGQKNRSATFIHLGCLIGPLHSLNMAHTATQPCHFEIALLCGAS